MITKQMILIGFAFLLCSCSSLHYMPTKSPLQGNGYPITSTSDSTPSSPEIIYTPTKSPSITPSVGKNIITVTPYPLKTPQSGIADESIPSCIDNGQPTKAPENFGINGVIVYRGNNGKGIFKVGGSPLVYSQVPSTTGKEYELWGFSPDGKTLAFSPIEKINGEPNISHPTYSLISVSGEINNFSVDMQSLQAEIPKDTTLYRWISFSDSWYNDEYINLDIEYAGTTRIFTMHHLLDIRKHIWRDDIISNLPGHASWAKVGLSQDMTRALYTKDPDGYTPSQIVLWDLINQKEITNYSGAFVEWDSGHWSPDSKKAVIIANPGDKENLKLYIINRDGGPEKEIPIPVVTNSTQNNVPIEAYWSPNNRYLAIYMNLQDKYLNQLFHTLYIYDTITEQYQLRCPLPEDPTVNIYWSPDNRYVVPTNAIVPDSQLIIYDIQRGNVISLAENALVGGWSDQFSEK